MRNKLAHFGDGNRRQSPDKEEEQRNKQTHGADEGAVIPERRLITTPRAGNEIARQADDDDDEALEPHAKIDDQRHDEKRRDVHAHFLNPKKLRREDVAQNQREIVVVVRAVQALLNKEYVKLIAAVGRKEEFHEVAVRNDQARGEQDLRNILAVNN